MKIKTKIAVFFGGKVSQHLVMLKKAARELGVRLDLVSYNRVWFEAGEGKVKLRGNLEGEFKDREPMQIGDYDVLFFRTTGKHWEEVDLIVSQISDGRSQKKPIVVDPIVELGKPSYACKAWQMLKLSEAGIEVPRTIYGSLWYLYEVMKVETNSRHEIFPSGQCASHVESRGKFMSSTLSLNFPVIVKGSGGDRGTRVYKADNLEEMERLVRELRKSETEEGKRYMLQEYIENDGDYRVLVLGEKVLGVMKRCAKQNSDEFRNNYSMGGSVEVADLPEEIKNMAVEAAKVCGLAIAGVDVMAKKMSDGKSQMSEKREDYVILEVNKGPQFKGFMAATGIDVPKEIVKFLVESANS